MDAGHVKKYFEKLDVVCEYARAVESVGLWESEKLVFGRLLRPDMDILELGCGAGRIAHGLYSAGFKKITATDFSENMIDVAKAIALEHGDGIRYMVEDARQLSFNDASFDAAIFGFNGLMQIPGRAERRRAMCEAFRVLRPGGVFIFTTHDRDTPANADFWKSEKSAWDSGQRGGLDEFGDRMYYDGSGGYIYIHSPVLAEVESDLCSAGFANVRRALRSEIAAEPSNVAEFSDECVFWFADKL